METWIQIQLQFMAGCIVLLLCRPLLAKFPRVLSYGLWCMLFLRLLCPFSIELNMAEGGQQYAAVESEGSNLKEGETVTKGSEVSLSTQKEQSDASRDSDQTNGTKQSDVIQNGTEQNESSSDNAAGSVINQSHVGNQGSAGQDAVNQGNITEQGNSTNQGGTGQAAVSQNTVKQSDSRLWMLSRSIVSIVNKCFLRICMWVEQNIRILAGIWGIGMVVYLLYALSSVCRYRRFVSLAVPTEESRVWESGQVASPFVFGIRQKKIILPVGLAEEERKYIICHESMHIHRKDDVVKWIVFILSGIYWFQPMVWVAAYFLEQDMEMSCDEMVIRKMGNEIRKEYAQSLLSFATGKQQEMLPLAFASGGVKSRIRNVLQPGRFRKWMIPFLLVLVLLFAAVLYTKQSGMGSGGKKTAESTSVAKTESPADTKTAEEKKDDETSDDLMEGMYVQPEDKAGSRTKNAIEKNFGKFYDYVDSSTSYETYFIERYEKYRLDDLSQWKDEKGQWCYPKEYEFVWIPSDVTQMAAQQFPPELLEDMDTEELLSFILQREKRPGLWGWNCFDNYLMGLSGYYRYYNCIHELMNRKDCAQVIHQKYQQYSEDDQKKYSKLSWHESGNYDDSTEAVNFQLVESLEWFFLALEGKAVPDELVYGSDLERSLDRSRYPKEYVYHEDVTHDGIEDTITLHMEALYDESLATGEEETVTVTSGKTGKKIASYTADTVHYGWNGIYLYENELGKYLIQWQPAMYQGVGAFQFRVFSLKEDGTEEVEMEKEFRFDLNPGRLDFDKKAFQEYMDLVNTYLKNSYVIIDTDQGEVKNSYVIIDIDQGEVMYSTEEGQLMAPYDGSWVIDEYKENKKISD